MALRSRRKHEVLDIFCIRCGRAMKVVKGSAPDRERVCNLCVYDEIRRGGV